MPKLKFIPSGTEFAVEENTKILAAALSHEVAIQYGCGACRCGTCGVRVSGGTLKSMNDDEKQLLEVRGYPTDGSIRLACQARVVEGEIEVDIGLQSE